MEKTENTNVFNKGLYTDTNNRNLPKTSYYYALNSINETQEGDKSSISNLLGNEVCGLIPSGYSIIGYVLTSNDEFVVFSTNNTNSEIGLYNSITCAYTSLLDDLTTNCLNFSTSNPINAILRFKNGCDRIIYFTDNYNPYRSINIDNLTQYFDSNGLLLCNKINLSKNIIIPNIQNIKVEDSGGNLKLGSYQFLIRYFDEDLNPTNWLYNTPHVYVYDESSSSTYTAIDGGKNIIDSSSEIGVYPPTNKSIKLSISNIDTSFTYYQYAIVEYTTSLQTASTVLLSEQIPTTDLNWIYTGYNTTGSTTVTDLIVDKVTIDIVKAHQQIDNRLFLANLTESKKYDWAKLQRAALGIKVKWVAHIKDKQLLAEGDSKGSDLYKTKSYMRDEIYSLGIRGILNNGSYTPVVHIPGRDVIDNTNASWSALITAGNSNNKDIMNLASPAAHQVMSLRDKFNGTTQSNWDKQLLTIVDNKTTALTEGNVYVDNVKHLGLSSGTVERWKVFNTGIVTSISSTFAEGEMSYYESGTSNYPEIVDCDGNEVYGALAGTPIRHHKFPDTNTFPHVIRDGSNLGKIAYMGLEFNIGSFITYLNTNHPELVADVQKWEIVQAERTEANKTVLDKGITTFREMNALFYGYGGDRRNPGSIQEPTTNLRTDLIRFYSPKTLLTKETISGGYMKVEYANLYDNQRRLDYGSFNVTDLTKPTYLWLDSGLDIDRASVIWIHADYLDGIPFKSTRHYYPYNIQTTGFTYIDSTSNYSDYSFVQAQLNNLPDTYVRNYNYTPHTYQMQGNFQSVFNNSTNSSVLNAIEDPLTLYASLKDLKDVYLNLDTVTYFTVPNIQIDGSRYRVYGGDTFIAPFNFQISSRGTVWRDSFVNTADCPSDKFYLGHEHYFFYVESDINAAMRHASVVNPFEEKTTVDYDNNCGRYFKGSWIYKGTIDAAKNAVIAGNTLSSYPYLKDLLDYRLEDKDDGKVNLCKEFFGYNKDYSNHNRLKPYYSTGFAYDYCSTCENRHPYRIVYSQKSFQEEKTDNYKQFLSNNYLDLDGSTGEINYLFKDKDQLYALTDKSIYFLPVRPQTIQSNESNIYIGTGDVLSIPPKRLATTDYAYSGTKDVWSVKTTEFGTIYCDSSNGRVFHLANGLNEISNIGMRNFFHKNLPSLFKTQFKQITDIDYPKVVTTDINGIGITAGYDPRYRLYYLTKKDYIANGTFVDDYDNGAIVWDNTSKVFKLNGSTLNLTNTTYFNDMSYTLAFSLEDNAWVSFYSFIPNIYMSNSTNFLSFKSGNRSIWLHDKGNYQTFYDTKYAHIIEFIANDNPYVTKVFDSMKLYSKVYIKNGEQFSYLSNKTFDNITVYTSNQTTKRKALNLSTSLFNTNANVRIVDNYIYISDLRNVFPANDSNTGNIFIGPYFKREENPLTSIPSMYNQDRLKDQWFGVRLEFNPSQNYKITTDLISTRSSISYR